MYYPVQGYGFVVSNSMMEKFMKAYNKHCSGDVIVYEDAMDFAEDMGLEEFDTDCTDGLKIIPVIPANKTGQNVEEDVKNEFRFFVYWLNKQPTLFAPAYSSVDDIVSEIQNLFNDMDVTRDEILACIANVKIAFECEDED